MITITRTLGLLALVFSLSQTAGAQPLAEATAAPRSPQAVTLWWVVFNQPENCYGSADPAANCTSADVFGHAFLESVSNGTPDPSLIAPNMASGVAVLYATGGLTDRSGRIRLAAALYKTPPGQAFELPAGVDPMGFGKGLETDEAEIHLVVRSHGDAERRDYLSQITNFLDPYCSDPNLLYVSGPNLCSDEQFAVYGAQETGTDAMYGFADPVVPLRSSRVHLSRHADVVRAVVQTRLGVNKF